MKKLFRRTRRRRNLATIKAVILVSIVVVTVGLVSLFFYKISQGKNTSYRSISFNLGTFSYGGSLFPKMPQNYIEIHQEISVTAEIDYLAPLSISQVGDDIRSLCTSNGFKVNLLNTFSSSGGQAQSTSFISECTKANKTWNFDVSNAAALSSQSWRPSIKSGQIKGSLTKYSWLQISSMNYQSGIL